MSTRLLIARHGNTFQTGEVVRRVGTTDLPLVESGLEQGRRLGAYFKHHQITPDIIFTSTLKRTIQTAEQIQHALQTQIPMQHLSVFNEIDYGPDENQPEDQVVARIGQEALTAWESHARVPQGWNLSPQQLIQAWQDFAADILKNNINQLILVITSNGIARFAPYLTGDFHAFCNQFNIKLATGAFSLLEKNSTRPHWDCVHWNTKP